MKRWSYTPRGQQTARCDIDPADAAAMAYTCSATTSPPAGSRVRRTVSTYCEAADVAAGTCPLEGLLVAVNGPRLVSDPGMGGLDDVTTYTYRDADDPTCATSGVCTYRKGDLWKVTNALGQVTETVSYDKAGRVTRTKEANGVLTDFAYHPRGWLVDRIVRASLSGSPSPDDATTHIDYDAVGSVQRTTQPDGSYLHYTYDAAHRLLKVEDNLGNTLDYCPGGVGSADCLDAAGNRRIEQVKESGGAIKRSLRRTYNQLGQLTAVLNAQSQTTLSYPAATGYDANGNPTHSLDGLSVETRQEYDPLNRLKKTIQDYLGPDVATRDTTTEYTYDARDNLRTVKDPDNLTTTYDYDGLNDLTGLHSPDTGTTAYTYDLAGNRITQTDARNVVSTYVYDRLNRLTAIQYPTTALNVGFFYDQSNATTGCAKSFPLGRLTRITDASGSTTYCYDRRGNVTRKTQVTAGVSQALAYTWTKADRLETITYPSSGVATYGRNAIGQVTSITWKANSLAPTTTIISNATWYPFGPLNALTFGNGRTLTKTYDTNYAIDSIASSDPNGLVLDLTTDVMGNITAARDTLGAPTPTRTYQYDRLYRLKNVIDGGSGPTLEGYQYNKTGDRTQKTLQGQSPQLYAYLAGTHHLDSVGGIARTYDANGNTTGLPDVPYPLVYDDRNRLARTDFVGVNGDVSFLYAHNGKGERVRKHKDAFDETQTQTALYDEGGRLVREHASRTCTGGGDTERPGGRAIAEANAVPCNGTRVVELIYLDDVPVAQITDGQPSYLETDHLGTPRVAANTATNAWQWKWNFFGSAFGEHSPAQPTTGGIDVSLRYPGQQYDAEAGLHYNYFRDNEPGTGRYVESDPIGLGAGHTTYGYVGLAPLKHADRFGLFGETTATVWCRQNPAACAAVIGGGAALVPRPNALSSPETDTNKSCPTCSSMFPQYDLCFDIQNNYPYSSWADAIADFPTGSRSRPPTPATGGLCAIKGEHRTVFLNGSYMGSMFSCYCCSNTSNGPVLREMWGHNRER